MRSRNYTNEIGVTQSERRVPAAVAFVILAIVAAAAVYFIRQAMAAQPAHQVATDEATPVQTASR